MLQEGKSKTQLNDGYVRNMLGSDAGGNLESTGANLCLEDMECNFESQVIQLMRIECCSDESKTFHQDHSVGKITLHSNKQHSGKILSTEVANKRDDVTIIEKSEKISNAIRNQNLNGAYSGNIESNNRQHEQDGNKQRLLIGSTSAVESVTKALDLPNDR
ncbi:MAG: hypothetical protein EZS28_024441 [Streblomastix strix]|uniref:Uncharacterized protein n=1 Tax=Streblomastix strix TaxID=222440 RepID=A0A5J4VBX8_9EUKA|nr:MAG: hypothetical protein EZS28_024441 [Streblomastix strix]